MNFNFIHLKFKNKNNIHSNKNKSFELLKLSVGNNIINKNKKESSNKNLDIIYYKEYTKKNVGKMIYADFKFCKLTKILDNKFIANNIKRAKIIINSKQYKLKENIVNQSHFF